jgi:porin
MFSRMSTSPSDRNLINAQVDVGVVFNGMVPGRPHDKFGAVGTWARFSDAIRDFDRDTIAFSGVPGVIRDYEANLEISYQAQIVPGWYVQPLVTRIWHPGGDASRNALVTGVRSIWRY